MIEGSEVAIAVFEAEGHCVLLNDAYVALTGGTVDSLITQNFRAIPAWRQTGFLAAALETLRTGTPSHMVSRIVTSFDRELWIDVRFARITRAGRPNLLFMGNDISEQKLNELRLAGAKEEAERASQAKSDHVPKPIVPADLLATSLKWVTPGERAEQPIAPTVEIAANFPKVDGIDEAEAFWRLGGNLALYNSLLGRLEVNYAGIAADGAAGRQDQALAKLHGFKGTAASVSAKQSARMAALIETFGSTNERLFAAIRAHLATAPAEDAPAAADLDDEALDQLARELREQSVGAIDRFESVKSAFGRHFGTLPTITLAGMIEDLRFAEALQLLDQIREQA